MTPPVQTATTTCPSCGARLRLSSPGDQPVRLRVTCGACRASFHVQWPGSAPARTLGPIPTGIAPTSSIDRSTSDAAPGATRGATPAPAPTESPTITAAGTPIASVGPPATPATAASLPAAQIRTTPLPSPKAPVPGPTRSFVDGELVAGRYRVVRFLAEGGMGEVFEIEDLELGGRLAAKTVRADVASDPSTMERFRREIQLARRVTHPNVCRIFDIARHRPDPDRDDGTTFLTMELLVGQTLAQRIVVQGAMTSDEALPILRQIAAALDAAHDAGVIHRDLKPGNVILVPAKDGGDRAVVTDFGLARTESGVEGSATMTAAGFFIGTPAYISPEQIEGGEVTPAVDVYALGIVAYEMLTGTVPFSADTAIATAVKRLNQEPPPLRLAGAQIDARWEAAVLRCLERRPEERFARAGQLIAALDGHAPLEPRPAPEPEAPASPPLAPAAAPPTAAPTPAPPPRRKLATALLAAVILASFGIALYRIVAWRDEQRLKKELLGASVGEPIKARRSVAVLGFKDRSGRPETAWLSGALAEMLGTELASERELRVIAGEEVARMKRDLAVADSDSLARDTLAKIRTAIGADFVVLGSYTALGQGAAQDLRLDVRLQDTRAGETTASMATTGTEAKLFDLVASTGARLRQELGLGQAATPSTARARRPVDPEAARLYTEGLERLRGFDPQGARDLLARAVAADPQDPLAHSALAAAWANLGYRTKAADEAKTALDLARDLPDEQRLAIEGRYAETTEDWPRAVEIYASLARAFPDDLDHGLRLAAAQNAVGDVQSALTTIAALRRLPTPSVEDPRIDLAEATAAEALGDFARQRDASTKAAARAEQRGTPRLAAPARLSQCRALRNLGQAAAGQAACQAARELYERAGDRVGVADAITQSANLQFDAGDLPGARRLFEQALGTYRETGDKLAEAGALNNLAVLLRRQGETAAAVGLYEQALALARETNDRKGGAAALANLAAAVAARGDLERARQLSEEALAARRALGDKVGEAAVLDNLGAVLRRQGDLAAARGRQESALAIRRSLDQAIGLAASLNGLGSTQLDQGELAAARGRFDEAAALGKKLGNQSLIAASRFGQGEVLSRVGDAAGALAAHREALAIRGQLGERSAEAASRLALAQATLAGGDPTAAAESAAAAAGEFERLGMVADQAIATAVLAECGAGRAGAKDAARARALVAESQDRRARLIVALRTGRRAPGDLAGLRAIANEARDRGFVEVRLEAELALAELDLRDGRAGHAETAQRGLAAIADEAAKRGYAALAARARTASTRP